MPGVQKPVVYRDAGNAFNDPGHQLDGGFPVYPGDSCFSAGAITPTRRRATQPNAALEWQCRFADA